MKKDLVKATLGESEIDLVLKNGNVLNMFTEEIIKTDVAIIGDTIVGLGTYSGKKELDCTGKYISPGLIDAHMHIESSMVSPVEFAKSVAKKGTTTIITDPHEIVNVMGKVGLDYMIDATENIPINAYIMLPSCVPAADIDTNGSGEFSATQMLEYLKHPRILGLAEVMRVNDVINCEQKMYRKINLFKDKIIDGHAPGLSGRELQAYKMAGICNDHESEDGQEAIEKIRAGFHLMIREGSSARNLEPIIKTLIEKDISLDRCMFCTDDKHLQDIENEGHINFCVRKAIDLGLPAIKAYKMATYQPAQAYNLKKLGAIGAGYKADIIILENLYNVQPETVLCSGVKYDSNIRKNEFIDNCDTTMTNSIKFNDLCYSDIKLKKDEKNHVIELVPYSLLTKMKFESLPGKDLFTPNQVYSKLCVVERHGKTNNVSVCALKGYGIKEGAIASSISHDSHNIVAVGDNDADLILAINEQKKIQGGIVIVSKGVVVDVLSLEIAGLMTSKSYDFVRKHLNKMLNTARKLKVSKEVEPFMSLAFLSLTAIPEVRLIEKGLYSVISGKLVM